MTHKVQHLARIGKIQRSVLKGHWECMYPGCNKRAINTHLLQQHGVLNTVSASHQYVEIKFKYPPYWNQGKINYEFKKCGITDTLSFPVFCNEHDTKLFSRIEIGNPDFDDYTNQLLLCLRTISSDIRKIEIVLTQWKRMVEDVDLLLPLKESTLNHINTIIQECSQLDKFRDEIIEELKYPLGRYYFRHYSYPKVEVYGSASIGNVHETNLNGITKHETTICFVHLIPTQTSLEIVIGYPLANTCSEFKNYIELWNGLNKDSLGRMLTELFANRIENFGMSLELYQRIPSEKKEAFISYLTANACKSSNQDGIDFNLFDGLIQ